MFIEQPGWQAALEDLQHARTILLLGGTDTGKTTFLTWLTNALLAREGRIAIVDADVGQSSLGPPTTIGLGVVAQALQHLQELPPTALYFVGSTSPRGHLLPVIVGTKRMVERAQRIEADQVIIDTCGFISADGGQVLKYYQIDLVETPIGRGTALDVESLGHRTHVRTPAILWAEQRDGELHVILQSRPSSDA